MLDFGQYVAGPMAALLLADQGAEVVRIDPPGGPRWDTPANAMLLRGRQRQELDLREREGRAAALDLVATADVVVENFRPGVMERLGVGSAEGLRRNPRLIYCSLPGFGSDDPRAGEAAWEGVVLAAAGAYATGSAEMLTGEWWPADGPAFSPLLLGSVFAGMQAATAVTAALVARDQDGVGQRIEIPLHDAFFEAVGARALSYERNEPTGRSFGAGLYRCADGGYVSLITVWYRHLEWFLHAAGAGSWITEGLVSFERLTADPEAGRELSERLVELLARRPAGEWEELGRAAGVPIAAVRTAEQWMHEDHAVASGTLVDTEDPVLGAVRVPGPAIRWAPRPAEPGVAAASKPLRTQEGDSEPEDGDSEPPVHGLRVLDMTRVLAAPSASRLLAELGADVVQADVDPAGAKVGLRQPFFHEQANRGKRSIVVDLGEELGRLRLQRLLRWADMLITNFTPPTLRRLGLCENAVREVAPDVVYVYLNTFGTSGPWAELRGYAEIANTVTGITARTLGAGPPSGVAPNVDLPRSPFTDYAAGVLGAFAALAGWYHRHRTGQASRVETSLVAASSYEQVPYLIDHANKEWNEPRSPALGWGPLQRLYRTAGDWVFVGADDQLFSEVSSAFGVDRETAPERLEERLEEAFAACSTAECLERLRRVGAGAHPVLGLDSLFAAGGSADQRGLRLAHRSREFGTVVQPGPTIRFDRTPMRAGGLPAAGFGANQEAILAQLDAPGV